MIANIIERVCRFVAARLPSRDIYGNSGPCLSRWTLLDAGKDRFRLYLHHFHRSDEDRELHTHPWKWAIALQLIGGYREERRGPGGIVHARALTPGRINVFGADTAHRVDLLDEERGAWSLILTGPIVASWGFWDRDTRAFTPWREFIRSKGAAPIENSGGTS